MMKRLEVIKDHIKNNLDEIEFKISHEDYYPSIDSSNDDKHCFINISFNLLHPTTRTLVYSFGHNMLMIKYIKRKKASYYSFINSEYPLADYEISNDYLIDKEAIVNEITFIEDIIQDKFPVEIYDLMCL